MKKLIILLVSAAAALSAQTNEQPLISAIDGYAARVNDRIITYGDIREHIAPFLSRLSRSYQGEELARQMQRLFVEGREALIEEVLIQEGAKNKKLQLPDHIIDEEVETIIRDRFNGDRALLTKALIARRKTFGEWRQEIADQFVTRVFYSQEVLQNVHVSEEAVRAEYERTKERFLVPFRVKYRYILINKGITEEDRQVKRKQAEDTLKKLQDGAGFEVIAKDVSEGDLSLSPWRDPADVKEEMRPALRNTPAGQISGLIEGEKVYYIIKVESRQEEGCVPFEDVSEAIRKTLEAKERERLHARLVERLSAAHHVKRY
jgi:parvulin-like peptidyl-prolyl isomerase